MRRGILLVLTALVTVPVPSGVFAAESALTPSHDATLFEDAEGETASGSGVGLFIGNNSAENTRRALIAFAVDEAVPSGATIEAVELRLSISSAPLADTVQIAVHLVSAAWGEGASVSEGGRGAPAEPGDATWLHRFYPDTLWASPGGDFQTPVLAVQDVGPDGLHSWSGTGLVGAVQSWVDDPSTNFGFLLMGDETGPSTVRRVDSREHPTPLRRPVLLVTYTIDDVAVEPSSWGSLKKAWVEAPFR